MQFWSIETFICWYIIYINLELEYYYHLEGAHSRILLWKRYSFASFVQTWGEYNDAFKCQSILRFKYWFDTYTSFICLNDIHSWSYARLIFKSNFLTKFYCWNQYLHFLIFQVR